MGDFFDKDRFAARYDELTGEVPGSVDERWDFVVARGRSAYLSNLEGIREQAIHNNPLG